MISTPDTAPFDRALLARRRRRWSRPGQTPALFLAAHVAEDLAERVSLVQRRFSTALDLGGDGGELARRIAALGQTDRLVRLDPDAGAEVGLQEDRVAGDEEALPFAEGSFDLVTSNLGLHLTNDTPGVLLQIRRALRPDGLLVAAMLGGETLTELRQSLLAAEAEIAGGASPRVLPFAELRDAGGLLQRAGFALPVIDQDRLTVRYDHLFALMADLRAMGGANILVNRSRRPVSRRLFLRAAELYAERFGDADGRIRATFDVIHLSGWRPHDSQQKPLKPGSARASLADALKAR
jgi:SAM-dependent methyltransferase